MSGIRWRTWLNALIAFREWVSTPSLFTHSCRAAPAKPDDTCLRLAFPAVGRKKVTAAFDGARLTSDGGVMLLAIAGGQFRGKPTLT